MGLFEQINADIITAMKTKEKEKLTALRAVKAQLLLLKTSGSSNEITEKDEITVLQKMVKQRKEAAEIYKRQGRDDLFETEMTEAKYIQAYLSEQMSDEELTKEIKAIVEKTGASSIKDMGKVMGIASGQLAGKTEGKLIAAKVKELLGL